MRLLYVRASHSLDRAETPPRLRAMHRQVRPGKVQGNADTGPGLSASLHRVRSSRTAATLRIVKRGDRGRSRATPVRQGFPTGVTPPKPVNHWEQKTIGSSVLEAYFKSTGFRVMLANWCFSQPL